MNIYERKVLIVDDEKEILEMIEYALKKEGFKNIYTAKNKRDALETYKITKPDMAILDILLPDGSGFEIIEYMRQSDNIPVLFLSALSDIDNKYEGFNLGADDYMVKPFMEKELSLRMKAILNRSYGMEDKVVYLKHSYIDFDRAVIVKEDQEYEMTAKEYNILKLLHENKNKVVTIDGILSALWGQQYYGYENTLMTHIRKIRQKIEKNPSKPESLVTYKGLGYKLKEN
ncbi:response regulator transcription factor [Peptostreptococcus faecalis]|uniref:response regulator transcription factor n=1 Tax=Peptostreptococcus faecalis TaxID=2045015 RepID=UPI000C7D612D|nr:response regulator transcription factor [Peptostreptococcus faecalis]